jgi:hypothetical protein
MSDALENVKERIRLLLNLARNNAATEGEISNALTFARRLMDAHHIDEADLGSAQKKTKMGDATAHSHAACMNQWETSLAWFMTELVSGVSWFHRKKRNVIVDGRMQFLEDGREKKAAEIVFYGVAEEAMLAAELYRELSLTIAGMARLRFGGAMRGAGRDYCEGFVQGLSTALQESKRVDRLAGAGALIVRAEGLVAVKKQEAANWLSNSRGIKIRMVSGKGTYARINHGGNAFATGHADGKKQSVNINRTKKLGE